MAPAKRKNTATAGASKKAKNSEWADISKEITKADLTQEVRDMLVSLLPLSLGEYADVRHKYQEQMVSALEQVLKDIEGSKSSEVTRLNAELETANKQKVEKEEAISEANRQKEAIAGAVKEKTVALAAAAQAFRNGRDDKNRADEAKQLDEKEVKAATSKKEQYVKMIEDLEFLRVAVPGEPDAPAKTDSVILVMKKMNFEESLQIALPAVFSKEPDARGQFDVIALDGLAKAIRNRISEQEEILAAAAPQQRKHEVAIAAAEGTFKSAIASQLSAAKAYEEAAAALRACNEEAALAEKAAKEEKRHAASLTRNLSTAEALLEIFRDGPLANFQRLQQRTEPVVEEPAAVVEEPTATTQEPPATDLEHVSEQAAVSDEVEQTRRTVEL
jgi:hypothetical protein